MDKPPVLALLLAGGHDGDMPPQPTDIPDELLLNLERTAEAAIPPEGQESSAQSIAHLVDLKRAVTPEVLLSLCREARRGRRHLPQRPGVGDVIVRK